MVRNVKADTFHGLYKHLGPLEMAGKPHNTSAQVQPQVDI